MDTPIFPVKIFPEFVRNIIDATHQDLNFPISYISASLFFAASVAVGNSRLLKIREGWVAKSNMYMALVGRPGSAKTHPINFALAPLKKHDNLTLKKYSEELEEYRRSSLQGKITKPQAKQIVVKDITIEAIAKVLQSNKHGICVHYNEFNGWLSSFNRHRTSGSDEEHWLSLYDGDPIVVNRKTTDDIISIPDPFVSVIGSIQPNILIKSFKGKKSDNGFIDRVLFVANSSEGKPLLWKDKDLPSNATEGWDNFIMNMLQSSCLIEQDNGHAEYSLDENAWMLIRNWQNEREEELITEDNDDITAIFRKIQDYVLRFCIPIQVMREIAGEVKEVRMVDGLTAAKAISLAEYFFETGKNIHNTIKYSGKEDLTKIIQLIDMLPTTFSRAQALAIGEVLGLSRSTIFRHITGDQDDCFVRKMSHGLYEKKV